MSTRLTVFVAALALAASPAFAQSNTATSPNTGNPASPAKNDMSSGPGMANPQGAGSSQMGTTGHMGATGMSSDTEHSNMGTTPRHHRSHMATERSRSHHGMRGGSGQASAADHSADQLNAQVLSNLQSGQGAAPPAGGMSSGGSMGTSGGNSGSSGPMKQ